MNKKRRGIIPVTNRKPYIQLQLISVDRLGFLLLRSGILFPILHVNNKYSNRVILV